MSWTTRHPLMGPDRLDELIVPAVLLGTDPLAAPPPQPGDTELRAPAEPADPAPAQADDGSIPLTPPPAPPAATDPTDPSADPAPVDASWLWATAPDGTVMPLLVVHTPDGQLVAVDVRGWNVPDGTTVAISDPGTLSPPGDTAGPIPLVSWQDLLAAGGVVMLPPASASPDSGLGPTDGTDVTDPRTGWGTSPLLTDGSWSGTTQAAGVSGWDVPGLQAFSPVAADPSAGPHLSFMA